MRNGSHGISQLCAIDQYGNNNDDCQHRQKHIYLNSIDDNVAKLDPAKISGARERARLTAEDKDDRVIQDRRYCQSGNHARQSRRIGLSQSAYGCALKQKTDGCSRKNAEDQGDNKVQMRHLIIHQHQVAAQQENRAVSEICKPQDAKYHRKANGNKRIAGPHGRPIDNLLPKHNGRLSLRSIFPLGRRRKSPSKPQIFRYIGQDSFWNTPSITS